MYFEIAVGCSILPKVNWAEGYDVINFGSSAAEGTTQATLGLGFRSRLLANLDLGVGYEKAVVSPEGLTDDRFTFDVSIRF